MGYVLQDVVAKGSKHTSNSSGFGGSIVDTWDSFWSSCSSLFSSDNENYDTHPSHDSGFIDNTKKIHYPQGSQTKRGRKYLYSNAEGIGVNATFDYIIGISITDYTLFVSASYQPINFTNRFFTANLIIKHNGQEYIHPLSPTLQGDIVQAGYNLIGNCTVGLPSTGTVNITLKVVFNYDTGIGYRNDSAEFQIYP